MMIKKYPFSLSVVSGLLLSLPWLLMGYSWVLFIAFVPLLFAELLIEKTRPEKGLFAFFKVAFPAFFIWNVLSTWWIAYVSVGGMLSIALLNSIVMSVVWSLRHRINRPIKETYPFFLLSVFWLTFEFLHYHWSLQWPWLNLGNGLANFVKFIQWYEYTGVLGGSLWVLSANFLIFAFLKNILTSTSLYSFKSVVALILWIGVPLCWSWSRYTNYQEKGSDIEVLALQPNIDPYTQKFSALNSDEQLTRITNLAKSRLTKSIDLLIAPETALPDMWEDSITIKNSKLKSLSGIFKMNPELRFLGGAITMKKYAPDDRLSETARHSVDGSYSYDIFNSALMLDSVGNLQIGHKSILVSGVEKMPFQHYFSFLERFLLSIGGTSGSLGMSQKPSLFYGKDSVRIGPIICFESVFGEYVGESVLNGACLLAVLTNDGWWKLSQGSYQHFSYSRLRAIETRRSIVRCANTGISGFINQRGDVLVKSALNSEDALLSSIRQNDKITFYTRYGDFLGRIAAGITGMILLYYIGGRFRRKRFWVGT